MLPKIAVLLSAYNGEQFIEEQINSILRQVGVVVHIFIRDDGSSDNTLGVINRLDSKQITVFERQNSGPEESFYELMDICEKHYDFYAFSDQDDVWLPNKCKKAIDKLDGLLGSLSLYCSGLRLVSSSLAPIGNVDFSPVEKNGVSMFFQNYASGNTVVVNKHTMLKLLDYRKPRKAVMHDWWILLLVSSLGGKIVYDKDPGVLYRQHDNNYYGMRLKRCFRPFELRIRIKEALAQAEEILEINSKWSDPKLYGVISRIICSRRSIRGRFMVVCSGVIKGRTLFSTIGLSLGYLVYGSDK